MKNWSLRSIQTKLIKIGAKVVQYARYVRFQLAEVALPRDLFRAILYKIHGLSRPEKVPQ